MYTSVYVPTHSLAHKTFKIPLKDFDKGPVVKTVLPLKGKINKTPNFNSLDRTKSYL